MFRRAFASLLPLISLLSALAPAQGIYVDVRPPVVRPPDTRPPAPPIPPPELGGRLVLERHKVTAHVTDAIASWRIEQVFQNPTDRTIEGVYLFPIPRDAIARGVSLYIDGKEMAGEVLDADKAREVYRDIVRRARDPALLEFAGQGLLRASIFPVGPRARVQVALEFASAAARVGEVYALDLPLRFAAEADADVVVDASLETTAPLATVYSPTHPVDVARESDKKARVTFEGKAKGRGDLRLFFGMTEGDLGMMLLAHRLPAQDGTFVLVLAPRFPDKKESATPRDVVFVLDRSGSMAGPKWDQAVRALKTGLGTLNPQDRFALLSFATDVRAYKDGLGSASKDEIAGAAAHLDLLRPAGGTNVSGSLEQALSRLAVEPGRLRLVAFLTDGLPTIGEVEPDRILAQVKGSRGDARIFAFGLGYDVNTYLLDRLAEDNRGASDYVAEGEDLEVPVSAFFAKVAEPVLLAPSLRFTGVEVHDVYPQALPDLFAGSALVVVGRFRGEGKGTIVLAGRHGNAERTFTVNADWPREDGRLKALPAVWAARKIGFLLNEIRLHGANQELVDAVISLGKEHGIVTPYTAGLVVEEGLALGRATGVGPERSGWPAPGTAPAAPGEARRESEDGLRRLGHVAAGGGAAGESPATGREAVNQTLAIKGLSDAMARDGAAFRADVGGMAVERLEAAGRRLVRMGAVVVDTAFQESMRESMQEIETYSDAWFALMDQDPALRELLALGEEIVFVKDGQAVWVRP